MLTHLMAAHPTMTPERRPLLGYVDLGSAGGTAAFPQMQKRGATRSRAWPPLVLVRSGRVRLSRGHAPIPRQAIVSRVARPPGRGAEGYSLSSLWCGSSALHRPRIVHGLVAPRAPR